MFHVQPAVMTITTPTSKLLAVATRRSLAFVGLLPALVKAKPHQANTRSHDEAMEMTYADGGVCQKKSIYKANINLARECRHIESNIPSAINDCLPETHCNKTREFQFSAAASPSCVHCHDRGTTQQKYKQRLMNIICNLHRLADRRLDMSHVLTAF